MSDHSLVTSPHESDEHDFTQTRPFGFWIYLMSDLLLFASLFATFAVLRTHYAGGPSGADIFDLSGVLVETACLLVSSFTFGLAMLALHANKRTQVIIWLVATFVLGAAFIGLELSEFGSLIAEGNGPSRSAFLSAFFTLVGTHGLHVSVGLLWILVLGVQIAKKGVTKVNTTRMTSLSLFWHFLDIVWICVFSFVYLVGAM